MIETNHIWRLLARKLSNEATENELQVFEELLTRHSDLQYSLPFFLDFWESAKPQNDRENEIVFNSLLEKMRAKGIDFH